MTPEPPQEMHAEAELRARDAALRREHGYCPSQNHSALRCITGRFTRRTPAMARFTVRSAPAGDDTVFGARPPLQRLALC